MGGNFLRRKTGNDGVKLSICCVLRLVFPLEDEQLFISSVAWWWLNLHDLEQNPVVTFTIIKQSIIAVGSFTTFALKITVSLSGAASA
jgi:hypothetical protein